MADFTEDTTCLESLRALTIEARVRPTDVDRGDADNTFNRIFQRNGTFLVTILNTDYGGNDIPALSGKANVQVKYRTDDAHRHTCPPPPMAGRSLRR